MIREVAVSPDGRYFATASFDSTARVWETATGRPAGPPLQHENYVATVAFSPDGATLAAGDYARQVKLWDWRAGKEARAVPSKLAVAKWRPSRLYATSRTCLEWRTLVTRVAPVVASTSWTV